jgi:hypothetical protein
MASAYAAVSLSTGLLLITYTINLNGATGAGLATTRVCDQLSETEADNGTSTRTTVPLAASGSPTSSASFI